MSPPFQYSQYRNPFVGSISDLITRPGDIRAAAAERVAAAQANATREIGAAQANAALASGNAWAGAAQNIGQTVAAIPGQMERQKLADLQKQNLQSEVDARTNQAKAQQRDLQAQTVWSQAIRDSIAEDGTVDHQKAAAKVSAAGFPVQANAYLEASQKTQKTALELTEATKKIEDGKRQLQQASVNHFGELASVGLSSLDKGDPLHARDTMMGLVANAAAHGLVTEEDAKKFLMDSAQAGPEQLKALYQGLIDQAPAVKDKNLKTALTESEIAKNNAAAVKPSVPKSLQSKSVLLDGKPAEASYNPADGSWQVGGQTVEPSRVKPIPPASTIINDQRNAALANLPTWATDASRPSGTDANKMDPSVRMTPNGLFQAAQTYIATGQFPPTGRGADPASLAVRAAINAKVGAIAAESGLDEPALRAFYKSNASSLGQQQKMYDAVQGFMSTADKNADLLATTLKKLPDIGSPVFNKPLRAFEKDVAGDTNLSQFATYIKSVQNEYGRIISQPNLAGQLTDSARHEASVLIDPNSTVPQIIASISALKNEGNNRLVSVGEQIQRIQQRLQNPGGGAVKPTTPKSDPLGLFGPR